MKKLFKNIFFSLLMCCSLINFAFAEDYYCTFEFNNNFRFGDQHSDIIEIQKFLNSDARSEISKSGPGSPEQETNYFGNSTANAIKTFQKISSLQTTGAFDTPTRTSINKICLENKKFFEKKGIKTGTNKPAPSTDLTIKIYPENEYYKTNQISKVFLESNIPINTPTQSSLIVDQAKVSDIRKLSQTKYVIFLMPFENASSYYIQVEAESIKSNTNITNAVASNELKVYKIAPQPIINIPGAAIIDSVNDLPKANLIDTTPALPPENFNPVSKEKILQYLIKTYNSYKKDDFITSKNSTINKKYGVYEGTSIFSLVNDPCGPAKAISPDIFRVGASIGTLQVFHTASGVVCSTVRSLSVPFAIPGSANAYKKAHDPFLRYSGYRSFDSDITQKFDKQKSNLVKDLDQTKILKLIDNLPEIKDGYIVLNKLENLPTSCNTSKWSNGTKFDRKLLQNEKVDCKQIFTFNENTLYSLFEEGDTYDFLKVENNTNKAIKLLAYPKVNYANSSCFIDKPLEMRHFPNGLYCCKNYPCNAIENMEALTYNADKTKQQIKMIYTTERTNLTGACKNLPKQENISKCPIVENSSGLPGSAYTIKLKYQNTQN